MTVCRHFARGFCKRGDGCTFAHEPEKQPAPRPPTAGLGRQPRLPCKFFAEGKCRKGAECTFLHTGQLAGGVAGPARSGAQPRPAARDRAQLPAGPPKACAYWAERGHCKDGDGCRFSHDGPRGQPREESQWRRLLDKVLKEEEFEFNEQSAERFAYAVEEYTDKDLPWRLTDRNNSQLGLKSLTKAVLVGRRAALLPIVRGLADVKWREPYFEDALNLCWKTLYGTYGVLEMLTREWRTADSIFGIGMPDDKSSRAVAEMAKVVVFGGLVGKETQPMTDLLNGLRRARSKDVKDLADRCLRQLGIGGGGAAARTEAAVVPLRVAARPGGRHSNDFADFRQVEVMPTVQEVLCEEQTFLPKSQNEEWLRDDPEAQLLDRHFRLLREDMLCPLRDSLAESKVQPFHVLASSIYPYIVDEHHINHEGEDDTRRQVMPGTVGIAFILDVPGMSMSTLYESLTLKGKVKPGNLMLLQRKLEDGTTETLGIGKIIRSSRSRQHSYEDMVEVSMSFPDLSRMLPVCKEKSLQLVLAAGSFFAYEPVLSALQKKVELQFCEELLLQVRESLAPNDHQDRNIRNALDRALLETGVEVDPAQRAAFDHAIDHRIALIVGPPGTGKSFVGVNLALAMLDAGCGPILVVCYTNHALDEFLGRLLERGCDKFVRVGGCSKDERMERFTLRNLAQNRARGLAERRRVYEIKLYKFFLLESIQAAAQVLFDTSPLDNLPWSVARGIVDYEVKRAMEVSSSDGFDTVGRSGKKLKQEDLWKDFVAGRTCPVAGRSHQAPWSWSARERRRNLQQWVDEYQQEARSKFTQARADYDRLNMELDNLFKTSERKVLSEAVLIGATTTGAAKYRSLLQLARIRVVIMEEAGEVLEAHSLTALPDAVNRFVMIGDHKQLRPKVESHALTVAAGGGYDLNRSLFERLIMGGMAHSVLEVQHRMRPEISAIARHMTYPELRDGPLVADVRHRPHIRGLAGNVIFIDHNEPEEGTEKELFGQIMSKVNRHEAEYCVQVVRFLLAQGYSPSDMTVLTAYLGQLRVVKEHMRRAKLEAEIGDLDKEELVRQGAEEEGQEEAEKCKAVRVSTVDSYQGEEANIIIGSLVRSNEQGNIGFLGKADAEQRVNVLCTRARCTLILIGNATCLGKTSPLWRKILDFLDQRGNIYSGLPVKCHNHGTFVPARGLGGIQALQQLVDRGAGCREPCNGMLPCGHPCPLRCHPYGHDRVECKVPIPTLCRAGLHRIMRRCCDESAPPCDVQVLDKCERGHPVVRRCPDNELVCLICDVLNRATQEQGDLEDWISKEKVKLLEAVASRAVSAPMGAGVKVAANKEAEAALTKLQEEVSAKRVKLEEGLAADLARAEIEARRKVERAGRQADEQKVKMQEQLQKLHDDVQEQLRNVEEMAQQQENAAKEAAEANVRARDRKLEELRDGLQRQLKAMELEMDAAIATRPDMVEVERKLEEVRKSSTKERCAICLHDCASLDGVRCQVIGAGHFLCLGCFSGHVKAEAERLEFSGEVGCPCRTPALGGCTSKPFDSHIMAWKAPEAFQVYNARCLALKEAAMNLELERGFEERLAKLRREMEIASEEAKIKEARHHIIEEIMTLRCPRCKQAFLDFSGCFALTCSRQGCGCAFCAHCLKDCGSDAHACAAQCSQVRGRGNDVFGSKEDFERIQQERRRTLIHEYLARAEFHNGLAERIRAACRQEFNDLGL